MPARALLIINPVSGDAVPNAEKLSDIRQALVPAPFVVEVALTTPERGASSLAREAVARGVEVVIVGGGDGTVSEVARELVNQPATLGVLPIGTFNNIARSLGIVPDLPVACAVIVAGHARAIDVGQANGERYFFEAAGAGLDATLFPLGEEIKGGRWMRVFQAARLTWQSRREPIEIELDRPLGEALSDDARRRSRRSARELRSRVVRRRALLTVVANGPYYGGGYTVAPGARLRDGKLTVSVYRNFSKWELLRHFASISRGRYHYSPKIETFTAAEVTLRSPAPLPAHVDGQPFGCLPITLRAVPGALRVFAPEKPVHAHDPSPPVALPVPAENLARAGSGESRESATDRHG